MDRTTLKIDGKLRISGDVIADIAEAAASEINGVSLKDNNRLETAVNIPFIKDFVSPVRVRVGNDAVTIDISVIIDGSYKAYEVAKLVQENVKSSVQNMTGIAVSKVNVSIVGIKHK